MPILKRALFFLITGLVCLWAGFWIGNHPQYYQKYLDLNKPEVLFYTSEINELFPPEFQKEIQKKSPVKIIFNSSDPEAADVLLVNETYLRQNASVDVNNSKSNITQWRSLFRLVSPDFQRDLFKDKKAIPILWKIENNKLVILSFVNDDKGKRSSIIWKFIQIFLNDEIHSHWLNIHHWNTTLLKFDEGSLDENRKASAVRKIKFNNIEI